MWLNTIPNSEVKKVTYALTFKIRHSYDKYFYTSFIKIEYASFNNSHMFIQFSTNGIALPPIPNTHWTGILSPYSIDEVHKGSKHQLRYLVRLEINI